MRDIEIVVSGGVEIIRLYRFMGGCYIGLGESRVRNLIKKRKR